MRNYKILITLFFSLGLLCAVTNSYATLKDPLTTIKLENPVHFLAADGSDLVIEPGIYTIEPAEEWIRLMSGERYTAVLIEATKASHELELEEPMGLSVPGETEEESDLHHVTLLLPGGQSLDATGTYSGIRPRGLFGKVAKNIKKRAYHAYKKARSSVKKTTAKARAAASKAKRHVELKSRLSAHKIMMETMKRSIKEANRDKKYFLDKLKKANKKKQQLLQKLQDKNLPKQAKDRLKQELKNLDEANKKVNFKLQKAAARMNQAQQAMSKMMKMMSDMQQAIIKNM